MNDKNNDAPGSVEESVRDLLNRSIDGEISGSEQAKLDRLLATSDDVSDLNKALKSVSRLLDELPQVDPPVYLQETIEKQIRLPVQDHVSVQDHGNLKKPGLFGSWLSSNWLRTGFALAAGVVLTVGVYEMGSEPINVSDSASLSGTMVDSSLVDQRGAVLDSIQLNTDKLNGLIELRGEHDLLTLDVRLTSDGPSEVIVNYSERGLEFDGVSRVQNPLEGVSVVNGTIHLASYGQQHFTLSLRRTSDVQKAPPLELEFLADSELIQKAELNISQF